MHLKPIKSLKLGSIVVPVPFPGTLRAEMVDIRTSLDTNGRKWIAARDLFTLIGMPHPDTGVIDDILRPVPFKDLGTVAGVLVDDSTLFYARVNYNGYWAPRVVNVVNAYWDKWFSTDAKSVHPMHKAYVSLLNECLNPAICTLLEKAGWQEPGVNALTIYEFAYPRLLGCIGLDSHVDVEDLSISEITMLMACIVQFSNLLMSYTVTLRIEDLEATYCIPMIKRILGVIKEANTEVAMMYETNREVVEAKLPDWSTYRELSYRDHTDLIQEELRG